MPCFEPGPFEYKAGPLIKSSMDCDEYSVAGKTVYLREGADMSEGNLSLLCCLPSSVRTLKPEVVLPCEPATHKFHCLHYGNRQETFLLTRPSSRGTLYFVILLTEYSFEISLHLRLFGVSKYFASPRRRRQNVLSLPQNVLSDCFVLCSLQASSISYLVCRFVLLEGLEFYLPLSDFCSSFPS